MISLTVIVTVTETVTLAVSVTINVTVTMTVTVTVNGTVTVLSFHYDCVSLFMCLFPCMPGGQDVRWDKGS